ncbi:MAG: hypothetical protein ABFD97_18230 [Syntrophobacter sp.]
MNEFHIEDRAGVKVVVYQDGSCGPATDVEIEQDATIAALREEVERLKEQNSRSHIQKDRDYWHKKAMDMLHGNFTQCCSYCGFEAQPPNGWEELQKHIEECPEHPLPKLRARVTELEGLVANARIFLKGCGAVKLTDKQIDELFEGEESR